MTQEQIDQFKQYRRTNIAEMRPYVSGESLSGISVSEADDPESDMGMVARNPQNHDDQWYVARKYFQENFEPVEQAARARYAGGGEADDSVLKLSELMRGLEIPPASAANKPEFFYVVGRAIADQAKKGAHPATAVPPAQPKVPDGVILQRIYDELGPEIADMQSGDTWLRAVRAVMLASQEGGQ